MASPVVVSVSETAVATAGTSHLITLPASIVSTDLVLILMDIGSTSATLNALTGWTERLDEAVANGLKILEYTGAGVPSNPTFITSASTRSASLAYRISGADKTIAPQIGTTATGTSVNANPPSVTPTGGVSKDYLSIAFYGSAGEEADDDTWSNTPPTNYTPSPPRQKACGTSGTNLGGLIASAERQITTGAAIDPGTFAQDVSFAWRAQHILIHPGAAPITGTVAVTQVAQTSTASGLAFLPVTGTSNTTQAAHTPTISGLAFLPVTGTVSITQDSEVGAAAGTNTLPVVTGTVAVNQEVQTTAAWPGYGSAYGGGASGTFFSGNFGSVAVTQAAQTPSASGTVNLPSYTGTVAVIQDGQTPTAIGTVTLPVITGTVAGVQDSQVGTAAGLNAVPITGTVIVIQAGQTSTATGTISVPAVTGTVHIIQDSETSTVTGSSGLPIIGSANLFAESDTGSVAGFVYIPITGTVTVIQADQSGYAQEGVPFYYDVTVGTETLPVESGGLVSVGVEGSA